MKLNRRAKKALRSNMELVRLGVSKNPGDLEAAVQKITSYKESIKNKLLKNKEKGAV